MRSFRSIQLAPLAALLLAGCYGEISDDTVSITRQCGADTANCTVKGIPTALQTQYQDVAAIVLASGLTDFTVDLGSQDFLQSEKKVGPLTFKGNLDVKDVIVQAYDLATDGSKIPVSLDGIQYLKVSQVPPGCATDSCLVTLAEYQRTGTLPDPSRLVLAGSGANLLALGNQLTMRLNAKGLLPSVDWKVDVTLDASLNARATF